METKAAPSFLDPCTAALVVDIDTFARAAIPKAQLKDFKPHGSAIISAPCPQQDIGQAKRLHRLLGSQPGPRARTPQPFEERAARTLLTQANWRQPVASPRIARSLVTFD